MKFLLPLLAFASFASIGFSDVITGFGTGDFNQTFSDFTTVQTAQTFNIQGTDFGSLLAGTVASVSLGNAPYNLQLTAASTGNATSDFQIQLIDSTSNVANYQGSFASFPSGSGFQTVTLTLLDSTNFTNQVSRIVFLTAGTSVTPNVNFTLDTLATVAVPEPSTYLLLGIGFAGVVVASRRKVQRA